MNFTREPIIETIITPKEGCKLVVRSSKAEGQEEYTVDALEVVSFGQSMFFRSMEKPKPFLVPVNDYEVMEAKESRVVLKSAQFDRTIKIGGGREASIRRESQEEEDPIDVAHEEEGPEIVSSVPETHFDRKRDRRRHRPRRTPEEREDPRGRIPSSYSPEQESPSLEESGSQPTSQESSASIFTHLIPPPTTLISETIGRYKEMLLPEEPKQSPIQKVEKPPFQQEKTRDGESQDDPNPVSRVMTPEEPEVFQTNQTHFSHQTHWSSFLP